MVILRCKNFLYLGLCCLLPPTSGASVCGEPGYRSYVSAALTEYQEAALDERTATTTRKDQELEIALRNRSGFSFGFRHRYTKFDFEGIDLQTNGHVHTSSFPVHWRSGSGNLRAAFAPALSASSNVLGHPQEYGRDTLQFAFALIRQQRISEEVTARYGICGDHSFGEYRTYPSATLEWRLNDAWKVELGYPASAVSYRPSSWFATGLRAAPDGNEWHVMNRSFEEESFLVQEAYALDWQFTVEAGENLAFAAWLGRQFDSSFEMTLASGERVAAGSESVNRIGAGIRWQF